MIARYAGRCAACRTTFAAGAEVRYEKGRGVTACASCDRGGAAETVRLDGHLGRVGFTSDDGAFAIADLRVRGEDAEKAGVPSGGAVTVAGALRGARQGDHLVVTGAWDRHPKFGLRLKVATVEIVRPSDAAGAVRYLERLPAIGPARAAAIVDALGVEGAFAALDTGDAAALTAIRGITPDAASEILLAAARDRHYRSALVFLRGPCDLSDRQAEKVIEALCGSDRPGAPPGRYGPGADLREILSRDPYILIDHVRGFGWERADRVAKALDIEGAAPVRVRAGLLHACRLAEEEGHTALAVARALRGVPTGRKVPGALALLGAGVTEAHARGALAALVQDGRIRAALDGAAPEALADADLIQRAELADAEALIVRRLCEMMAGAPEPRPPTEPRDEDMGR